jgi:hypothetical protein
MFDAIKKVGAKPAGAIHHAHVGSFTKAPRTRLSREVYSPRWQHRVPAQGAL